MSGIFISYRRDDTRGSAGRLYDDLTDRFGSGRVFRDIDAIQPGADYREAIDRLTESCDAMLVVIGNQWLQARDDEGRRRLDDPDDLVRQEVAAGLRTSKLVIPVLVEDAVLPQASELPEELRRLTDRNALPLSDLRWKYDVNVLAERLEGVVREEPAPAPPVPTPASPDGSARPSHRLRVPPWAWAAAGAAAVVVAAVVVLARGGGEEPAARPGLGPAQLGDAAGLALDSQGNLYVADAQNNVVKKVTLGGTITTVAGTGAWGVEGDGGPATAAAVETPSALAVDRAGNLYIGQGSDEDDRGGIRRVAPEGTITSVPVRAPGVSRLIVTAMAIGPDGDLLVATKGEVLRLAADGSLVAVAGSATPGYGGDGGPATAAKLDGVAGLSVASDGSIYIADSGNDRVRRVLNGTITTVAGTGSEESSGNGGPAVEAGVSRPLAVAAGDDGSLFIATGNQVRRVGPDGTISVFAGDPDDSAGFSGDGGPAASALLSGVLAMTYGQGALYVTDGGNDRVRRIGPDGIITTVA